MTNLDKLTRLQDGETYAQLCLDLTVYWRGSMFQRSEGILNFYELALKELEPSIAYYETGTMSGAKPLRRDSLDMIPSWLQGKPRRDIYIMNLESGRHPNEPSDRNFFLVADEDDDEPMGAIRLALPTSRGEDPKAYIELVRQLLSKLDFESAHAGYALNWDPKGDMASEAMQHMASVASRYYCVDLFELDVTLVSMRKTKPAGIKTIGWLTLLGNELISRLGGGDTVAKTLQKSCSVEPLPQGIMIRAGERPILGDRNRQEDLSVYQSVNRFLAPLRFVDHRAIFGSLAETEQWLARFDDENFGEHGAIR